MPADTWPASLPSAAATTLSYQTPDRGAQIRLDLHFSGRSSGGCSPRPYRAYLCVGCRAGGCSRSSAPQLDHARSTRLGLIVHGLDSYSAAGRYVPLLLVLLHIGLSRYSEAFTLTTTAFTALSCNVC